MARLKRCREDIAARCKAVRAWARAMWRTPVLIAVAWWSFAIFTHWALKRAKHAGKVNSITIFSNLAGWLLVMPRALSQGLGALRRSCWLVLALALMAGFEKNLTNLSLYSIGTSLKTALHTFNVIFTLFLGAALGVDRGTRSCIFECRCRGNGRLALGVALVAIGGIGTAALQRETHPVGALTGIALQVGSSLFFALKNVTTKMVLRDQSHQRTLLSTERPPTPVMVAFVANPIIGLVGLLFLQFDEKNNILELPHDFWGLAAAVAVSVTCILLLQLRLTQLTTPLTVSICGILKDVCTVLFFTATTEEDFNREQAAAYSLSALGCVIYFCSHSKPMDILDDETASQADGAVEDQTVHDEDDRMSVLSFASALSSFSPPQR